MTWHAALSSSQPDKFNKVYQKIHITEISSRCNLYPELITPRNIVLHLHELKRIKYIFSTWRMFTLSEIQLNQLPNLKVLFYVAGATDYFSAPLLTRGVKIVSAWQANSRLFTLPNVQLTTHIAGALNNETRRLANCVINEFQRYLKGLPLQFDISSPV